MWNDPYKRKPDTRLLPNTLNPSYKDTGAVISIKPIALTYRQLKSYDSTLTKVYLELFFKREEFKEFEGYTGKLMLAGIRFTGQDTYMAIDDSYLALEYFNACPDALALYKKFLKKKKLKRLEDAIAAYNKCITAK